MMRLLVLLSCLFFCTQAHAQNACRMQMGTPIFCDTFDTKNPGIASRTGDLDPNVWGVSRTTAELNTGQGVINAWAATQFQTCTGTTTVLPPNDIMICNGQLREASNDNGDVTVLAMYPKQPFDFAGRTGIVSFDVSNDTHGSHAAWPEFWMSDLPVPAPFTHFDSWRAAPQNGFGVRFDAAAAPGSVGICQNGNNLDKNRWTVGSAVVVRNYVVDENVSVQQLDCVISSPDNSGIMNHIELKISQNQIDIYATDAGVAPSPATLKRIAVVTNANLTLSRGLIWIEDAHYNADKTEGFGPSQRNHTFVWDNVAFDGPFTYRDFSYDALDNNTPGINNTVNLGKRSFPGQTTSWNVLNMPANPQAAAVRVLFNFSTEANAIPVNFNLLVNGHAHAVSWPFPDTVATTWRTFAITIPITDLVPGTNVVQLGGDQDVVFSNINIVLVNVPGGVPVMPGSNNGYPGGVTPPPPVNGVCGPANGTTVSSPPTTNLCSAGTASAVSGTGPWTWNCAGTNGGTTASCSANKTSTGTVGVCGSANGKTTSVIPTTNLCATGAASAVAGLGPWTWTCAGTTPASCSAPLNPTCTGLSGGHFRVCGDVMTYDGRPITPSTSILPLNCAQVGTDASGRLVCK